ncbi:MAG: hypothetical protein PHX83_17400 [Acidobacteriia bacterium]|nr:hypothetical protein [Terriglobia bacterium]
MWKTAPGSTDRLLQLCTAYFSLYVLNGMFAKIFTGGYPLHMPEISYLFNNTLGGSGIALLVVFALGWFKLKSNRLVKWGPFNVPSEVAYIIPSGICTAVVIPTTTLMYTLPISVMVAMVIMRGSIIVISRAIDEVQIRQGILKKRVYAEENWAVVFALLAVATNIVLLPLVTYLEGHGIPAAHWVGLRPGAAKGSFDFLHSAQAMTIMGLYVSAYMIRIYIMNYFKNTRGKGVPLDNKGFFAIEQIAACVAMVLMVLFFFYGSPAFGWTSTPLQQFHSAVLHPDLNSILSGIPYGVLAFFSVFIFMFKGRTATFAGLVNRLTSLLAGTAATLLMFFVFHAAFPTLQDWASVFFILVAVYFLARAEKKRIAELQKVGELAPVK